MPPEPVISLRGVCAEYDGTRVLNGINLDVAPLDFIGIVGPNGGGKSTLLRILLGLVRPTQGRVRILGQPVRQVRDRVGYVPQYLEMDRDFPIRVRDVVCMGRLGKRSLFRSYSREDREVVERALAEVGLQNQADRALGELSGGQRQRVLIARALAVEPEILLLDEPTASIDPQVTGSIYELLRRLNRQVTILLVTHDMGAVSSCVKTVGCLNRELHYHGTRELTAELVEAAYQCPIDLIAHGIPHRVFPEHGGAR
jgi:zinc transport system ATP-binding protein